MCSAAIPIVMYQRNTGAQRQTRGTSVLGHRCYMACSGSESATGMNVLRRQGDAMAIGTLRSGGSGEPSASKSPSKAPQRTRPGWRLSDSKIRGVRAGGRRR